MVVFGYKIFGAPMSSDPSAIIGLVILSVICGFVVLRLLTAPYFVWKEQNNKIESMRSELNDPIFAHRKLAIEYVFTQKILVSKLIAKIQSTVLIYGAGRNQALIEDYLSAKKDLRENIAQFSYETVFFGRCQEFIQSCEIVLYDDQSHVIAKEERQQVQELGSKIISEIHNPSNPMTSQ